MKIAHIVGKLWMGGAERFAVDLCNELSKNPDCHVYIISLCENAPENHLINEIDKNVTYITFGKKNGFSIKVLLEITKWLNKMKFDIVHTHLNSFEYVLPYIFFNNDYTKFFHTIHSTADTECPNLITKSIRSYLYRKGIVKPVAISKEGGRSFRKYYKLENNIVIENGRPSLRLTDEYPAIAEKYKRNPDEFLLVHVGRISPEKNQKLLIESVKKFNAAEKHKCRLLIIGDIRDLGLFDSLKSLSEEDPFVEFLGGKSNIADYLSVADVFCLTSFFEGMPISLIEAMSVGCIAVCTSVGGIQNMIINSENGFLSAGMDSDSYCNSIKEAVFHPDKSLIQENAIQAFLQNYHIERSCKKYLDAYHVALNLSQGSVYTEIETKFCEF